MVVDVQNILFAQYYRTLPEGVVMAIIMSGTAPKSSVDELFASPRTMLRRAEHYIADLKVQIDAFPDKQPWAHVVEKHVDGVTNLMKIRFDKTTMEDLAGTTFDAANNLRSVLDQAGYASACLIGHIEPKSAKFPFGPTEQDMVNNAKGGCKDLSPEIRDLFMAFKPYKAGNLTLWALNELANGPKHRILRAAAVRSNRIKINSAGGTGSFGFGPPFWDSVNGDLILGGFAEGSRIEYDVDVAYTVAIDHVDAALCGQDPVQVLNACGNHVSEVLEKTIETCRNIEAANK
jgi:hypothetical protein